MNRSHKLLALVTVLSVALTACGEKKDADPAAMKINGQVITAIELERQLEEFGKSPDTGEGITGKTMKSMIDKELMRQAAIQENLDKDENVRASLAAANRMILATAYMQKQVAAIGKPTDAEVDAYYNQHPDFFADRKVYDLQEVVIAGDPASVADIKAKLAGGIGAKDFLNWLGEKKIQNTTREFSASSDQIRDTLAQKFKDAKTDQAIVLDDAQQIAAIFINSVRAEPVSLAQASTKIKQRLFNMKMSDAMKNKIQQLNEQAKIEYVAPYTENGKPTPKE